MFTRGRVLIASLIAMSLVGGLLIAPAVGLSPATEARAGEGIAFASSEHWIDQSYEDATGVHVYVTEPTIHFYSEDEAEPPEGFANYDLQLQLVEAATSTQVAEKVLEMIRDYSASEAEWAVPAGLLEFGSNYQLRYRLTAGGEQGDWSGWFTLAITAPSVAPSLVAPDDGAISLKGVMLVAQIPNYVFQPDSFDMVTFTIEEAWQNGAPTIVQQTSARIDTNGVATLSFYPPTNAGLYRWSAQWIGAGYSEPSEFRELTVSEVAAPVHYLRAWPGQLSVLLGWQVSNPPLAPVQYLDIIITPGNFSLRVDGSASTATFSDLPLGDYVASITATNSLGTSAPVTKSFSVAAMRPPAPVGLEYSLSGSTAHLTWQAPANDGGSPIDHYRVDIRSYDGGTNAVLETTDLFADALLAEGFTYRVFVYAVNAVGDGDGAFSAFEVLGLPGAPQSVEIRQGDGFANIFWDAPSHTGGRTPTKYRVSVSGLGTHTVTATYGRMGAQFDGIENDKTYTVTIRAVNEIGVGEPIKVKQVLGLSSDLDSDSDGLPDVMEARFGSNSALADTDGDGISDLDEALKLSAFLSLTLADTDGNGISDADEDCDGDGISNLAEIVAGTNPSSPDTDHDTLSDSVEIANGTNPLKADTDEDGVSDDVELALGLDPNVTDSNGDGLPDAAEYASLTITDAPQLTPQLSSSGEPQIDPASTIGRVSAEVSALAARISSLTVLSSPSEDIVGSLTVVAEVFDQRLDDDDTEVVGPVLARLGQGPEPDLSGAVVSELKFGYSEGVVSQRLANLAPVRWDPVSYSWEFADNYVSVSTADRTISILSPALGVRYAVVDLGEWRAHVAQCDSGAAGRPQLDVDFVIDEMPSVLSSDTSMERFRAVRAVLDSLEPGDRASVREFGVLGLIMSFAGGGSNAWIFSPEFQRFQIPEEDALGLTSLELASAKLVEAEQFWSGADLDYYPAGPLGWDLERVLYQSIPARSTEVNPYVKNATPLECRKKVVVLVTNGSKSGALIDGAGPIGGPGDHPFLDSGTPVHVLDLGLGQPGSSEWLQELAEDTGGSYSYVPTQSDLTGWIENVSPPGWQQGDPNKDTDGDGIPDMVEIYGIQSTMTVRGPGTSSRFYSNPKSTDSDKDGIPDNVEIGRRLEIGVQGAAWSDTNINRSFWVVSDPSKADGDNDGLDDKAEYDLLMNPLSADGDGDGLLDGEEEMWGTFAQMYDTDSDDFSDAYEVAHIDDGFDPLVYNEKVSEYEWLAEAAIGFFCGEVDICSNSTIPWLVGNIASGILVFGDLRDGIAFIAKGDWLMASFCAVGLIPGIGDAAGATSKVTKFILKLVNPFGLRVASVTGVGSIASAGMHWRPAIQLLRQYSKTPAEFVKQLIKIDPGVVDSLRGTYRLSDKGITDLVSKNGFKRFQAYSLLDEASGQVRIITDYTAVTRPRFLVNGAAGEGLLAKVLQLPKGFKQKLDWISVDGVTKARFWDGRLEMNGEITKVFEAKVGYVSSGFAQAQVRKDAAWLIANPGKTVEWHFFASKFTGMIGPSEHVLEMHQGCGNYRGIPFSRRCVVNFSDLSTADADQYLACVKADGPVQLFELARLIRENGLDLREFDASLESLVPLWNWFISFAKNDYPGISAESRPRRAALGPSSSMTLAAEYASELIMHYLFEVTRGLLRDVEWVLERDKRVVSFHRVKMQSTSDDGVRTLYALDSYCAGHVECLIGGLAGSEEPGYLLNHVLRGPLARGVSTMERILAAPRSGVSILEGLGDPGPALPPLVFPSGAEATPSLDEDEEDFIGDELMLAHAKANPEDVSRAKPLDAVAVVEALRLLGCRTMSGEAVTVGGILAAEYEEYLRADEAAMFATESYRGKLRAVHVDAIEPSRQQWDEIMTVLQQLAVKLGARLARSEEFYPAGAE